MVSTGTGNKNAQVDVKIELWLVSNADTRIVPKLVRMQYAQVLNTLAGKQARTFQYFI